MVELVEALVVWFIILCLCIIIVCVMDILGVPDLLYGTKNKDQLNNTTKDKFDSKDEE